MQRLSNFKPKNLVEALDALDQASHPDGIEPFSQTVEKELGDRYLKTLGKTISTEWDLGQGSHLEVFFQNEGIQDVDQMTKIIMLAFYRKLNNQDCSLDTVKAEVKAVFK